MYPVTFNEVRLDREFLIKLAHKVKGQTATRQNGH